MSAPAPSAAASRSAAPSTAATGPEVPRSDTAAASPAQPPRKRNAAPLIALAAVIVLALIGVAGFAGYQIFFAPGNPDAEPTASIAPDTHDLDYEPDTDRAAISIEDTFSDAAVRAYLENEVDADGDGELTDDECAVVTSMELEGVSTVDRLDLFCNLERFSIDENSDIEGTIDFSGNPELAELSLPESAVVSGMDATQLREDWLTLDCTIDGDNPYVNSVTRDETGRVVSSTRSGGGEVAIDSTYEYDADGHLITRTSLASSGTTVYTFGYDAAGNMVTADWLGNHNAYSYDGDGRLTSVTQTLDGRSYTSTYTYDDQGRCTAKTYNDGRIESWHYDAEGRCVRYEYPGNSTMHVVEVTYGEDELRGTTDGAGATYELDGEGRIVSATSDEATATFSYDAHGNLTEGVVTYNDGRTAVYRATYTRRFVAKDTPPMPSAAIIGPSYDSDILAVHHQTLPYLDINGLDYSFIRNPTYAAAL